MAELPVVPGHFYVQAIFQRSDDNPVANTFCFRGMGDHANGELTPQALTDIRDLLDGFYGNRTAGANTVGDILATVCHSLRYVVYPLGQPAGMAQEIPSATWPATAGSGARVPPDVALTITWRTQYRGKSYRGRSYIGPLGNVAVDAATGRPASGKLTQLLGAAKRLYPELSVPRNMRLTVLSRLHAQANDVVSCDIDNEFDTQRRRGFRTSTRVR